MKNFISTLLILLVFATISFAKATEFNEDDFEEIKYVEDANVVNKNATTNDYGYVSEGIDIIKNVDKIYQKLGGFNSHSTTKADCSYLNNCMVKLSEIILYNYYPCKNKENTCPDSINTARKNFKEYQCKLYNFRAGPKDGNKISLFHNLSKSKWYVDMNATLGCWVADSKTKKEKFITYVQKVSFIATYDKGYITREKFQNLFNKFITNDLRHHTFTQNHKLGWNYNDLNVKIEFGKCDSIWTDSNATNNCNINYISGYNPYYKY